MIRKLTGQIIHKTINHCIIDVNGVGYKVFATNSLLSSNQNEKVSLWIHTAVREDALDLYGFDSEEVLNFFELLLTISGIGPKTALGIMNATTVDTLRRSVETNDISHLTKVSGIGKKNAEKIVLELRDKIGAYRTDGNTLKEEVEALEALKALGFDSKAAREALKEVVKDGGNTNDLIKRALKILGS